MGDPQTSRVNSRKTDYGSRNHRDRVEGLSQPGTGWCTSKRRHGEAAWTWAPVLRRLGLAHNLCAEADQSGEGGGGGLLGPVTIPHGGAIQAGPPVRHPAPPPYGGRGGGGELWATVSPGRHETRCKQTHAKITCRCRVMYIFAERDMSVHRKNDIQGAVPVPHGILGAAPVPHGRRTFSRYAAAQAAQGRQGTAGKPSNRAAHAPAQLHGSRHWVPWAMFGAAVVLIAVDPVQNRVPGASETS
jgi:hypothetical protein